MTTRRRLVITFPTCNFDHRALNIMKDMSVCLQAPSASARMAENSVFVNELQQTIDDHAINEVSLVMSSDCQVAGQDTSQVLARQLAAFHDIGVIASGQESGGLKANAFVFHQKTGLFSEVHTSGGRVLVD